MCKFGAAQHGSSAAAIRLSTGIASDKHFTGVHLGNFINGENASSRWNAHDFVATHFERDARM